MIPKIINYIHIDFSDYMVAELSRYNKLCIMSARVSNPDYEVRIFCNKPLDSFNNDSKIKVIMIPPSWFNDIHSIGITKVAHMADFIRYRILKDNGGIYSDTDVLIIKSLDKLLDNDIVVAKQSVRQICNGFIMCNPNNLAISETYQNYFKDYRPNSWTYNSMNYFYNSILNNESFMDNVKVLSPITGFHYPHFQSLEAVMKTGENCENCYAHHLWNSSPQGKKIRKYIEDFGDEYVGEDYPYLQRLLRHVTDEYSSILWKCVNE